MERNKLKTISWGENSRGFPLFTTQLVMPLLRFVFKVSINFQSSGSTATE
jgi:hypothetical protein